MSEISLKTVCCTCLSTDRRLYPLYKILDGINLLYLLLTHDPEAYKEGFYKDAASLLVCWECTAVISKIKRFQTQVCIAQKQLTAIADGRNEVKLETFSHLRIVHNRKQYQFQTGLAENFIDCGPAKDIKDESDSDDIPLSAFYYENNSGAESGNSIIQLDNTNMNADISNMKPNSNIKPDNGDITSENTNMKLGNYNTNMKPGKIKVTSKKRTKMKYRKYFSLATMNEQEMLRSIEKRKIDLEKDAAFKCKDCVLMFKTENKLFNHNRKLHLQKDNSSQCDICHAYIEDLHTHRPSHYHCYNCMLCAHMAYTHTDIVKHLKNYHNEICSEKKIRSNRKLKKLSLDEPKYPCPECDLNFHNKDLRWKHIQKAHREGFQCSWCEKKFAFKNNLERHERIHQGPLPREECPTCHKMIRIDLLKVHSRIHTDRQKYTCVECDKHFVSRETYESHLKYAQAHATVDVCRHKCGICEKRYRSRGELRDHVNYQHKGQTDYKCPVCDKGLATKRCIRRHVRRAHEGIKESAKDKICQQCGKAFRDNKGLIEHERLHSGARPLACRACGRAFRQRAALYAHTRRMHNTGTL